MNRKGFNKAIVIGLDGATYDLIAKWTSEGSLPNLKNLIDKGCFGVLKSVPNLNSAAAWSSMVTGLNPGRHGLFFFHEHIKGSFRLKFLNAAHRHGREIWDILGSSGRIVGVINVPMTFPSKKVNGFMLAGLDTPSPLSEGFSYPPGLYQELIRYTGAYTIECDMGRKIRRGDLQGGIEAGIDTVKQRTKAVKYLLNNRPWDFFMAVFRVIDNVQHHYWRYLDPEYPFFDKRLAEKYGGAIFKIYDEIDSSVGQIMDSIHRNTNVFVVSDHGSAPAELGPRFLNLFLEKTGYLSRRDEGISVSSRFKHHIKKLGKGMIDIADTYTGGCFRHFLKRHFFKALGNIASERYYPDIEWGKSRAYSPHARPEIWINLKGREPLGIVDEEEYERICEEIICRLNAWYDPKTGRKVVKRAMKRSDVYHGPFVDRSADIIVSFDDHFVTGVGLPKEFEVRQTKEIFDPVRDYKGFIFGKHADNGIIIASGPDINSGLGIEDTDIMDITPTILYLMGLELPGGLDGKILKGIIKKGFISQNPERISDKDNEAETISKKGDFTISESEAIKERLKGLGYIE
ncbi:alkaline phosphatase family protein [bacterium]|nr:alkaline phosphatase family protein [bacterium]